MNKKILILYTTVGFGHKSVAENIEYHLKQNGFDVRMEDILQVQSGKLVDVSKKIHAFINQYFPSLWSFLYTNKLFTNLSLPLRIKVAAKQYANTKRIIDEYKPDVVLCTASVGPGVIAYLKNSELYSGLFGVAFSDFHLHRYWLYDEVDFYLANIEEQKQEMISLGIDASKIFVCGITLKPKAVHELPVVRKKLGIAEDEKIILVANGSLGIGQTEQFFDNLITDLQAELSDISAKIVMICGKNAELETKLRSRFESRGVLVLGYYTPMSELYSITEIFISKPGGLSISEALMYDLPIVVTHWLPGQEELNIKYLLSHDIIHTYDIQTDIHKIAKDIKSELQSHSFRTKIKANPNVAKIVDKDSPGKRVVEAINSILKVG